MKAAPRFTADNAVVYDQSILARVPGYELMLELTAAALASALPPDARILVAGAGTGAEILRLAAVTPGWRFTAVDVSGGMLELARQKADAAGIGERVEWHEGAVQDYAEAGRFDAATSLLVSQFLMGDAAKLAYFGAIAASLKPGAPVFSVDCVALPGAIAASWARLRGVPAPAVEMMIARMANDWHIVPEDGMVALWRKVGLASRGPLFRAVNFVGTLLERTQD